MGNIHIKFDPSGNPEEPRIILGKRSGEFIGQLSAYSIKLTDSLNSGAELSCIVYKDHEPLWDDVKDFRLVYVPEFNKWFEIYVQLNDGENINKQITGTELAVAELSNLKLYDIEINTEADILSDDYDENLPKVLYDPLHPRSSVLHILLYGYNANNEATGKALHYTIGHVDSTIASIQRVFSFNDTSIYDAFQTIAEEIGCLFVFNDGRSEVNDIIREISVYDLYSTCNVCGYRGEFHDKCPECGSVNITPGYGDDTTIFVTSDELGEDIVFDTDEASVKNCFKLEAGDDLMTATVENCNPNGTGYLWNISDEMRVDMSETLRTKLMEYDADYYDWQTTRTIPLGSVVQAYNTLVRKYQTYDATIPEISENPQGYAALMEEYYDAIDFEHYLTHSLMPTYHTDPTTAQDELAKLTPLNLNPIAINGYNRSLMVADNAVLGMAKAIVSPKYKVSIIESAYENVTWTGRFSVTNYSDDEDTASNNTDIVLTIQYDDFSAYVLQKVDQTIANARVDNYDVVALFEKNAADFALELKKYALIPLSMFANCAQSVIDVLTAERVGDKDSATWGDTSYANVYNEIYVPYYQKLTLVNTEIALRESEVGTIQTVKSKIETEQRQVHAALNMKNYLGDQYYTELQSFRRDDKYSNSNYITTDSMSNSDIFQNAIDFLKMARSEIYKSSTLQHTISTALRNLLVLDKFKPLLDFFAVGNWLRIKVADDIYRLRLIQYEIDYDSLESISVDFSDVLKTMDGLSDKQSLMAQTRSMASSYSALQQQSTLGSASYHVLNTWKETGLDVTNQRIVVGASNQVQSWDEHGMLFRRYQDLSEDYSGEQLKILNSSLVITDDNWQHVKTAIGKFSYIDPETGNVHDTYGVNGETIVGKLLLGEGLGIYNSTSTMKFDNLGLYIANSSGTNSLLISPNGDYFFDLSTAGGDYIRITSNGDMLMSGTISASNFYISQSGAIGNTNGNFTVSSTGVYTSTDGTYAIKITDGLLQTYLSNTHTATLRSSYWNGGTSYKGTSLLSPETSTFLGIGYRTSQAGAWQYPMIFNYGLNPSGDTQRVLINDTLKVSGAATFATSIAVPTITGLSNLTASGTITGNSVVINGNTLVKQTITYVDSITDDGEGNITWHTTTQDVWTS